MGIQDTVNKEITGKDNISKDITGLSLEDKICEMLWQNGSDVNIVLAKYHGLTAKEVRKIKGSKRYKSYAKAKTQEYTENLDMHILGKLSELEKSLTMLHPSHKNYPHLLKAYTDLLKITAPIAERLKGAVKSTEKVASDLIIEIADESNNETIPDNKFNDIEDTFEV